MNKLYPRAAKKILPVVVGLSLASPPGWGQQLEEVVVTARKREERLQDVPIAITAFTAEAIERKGLNSLADVIRNTPGVQLTEGFSPQDQRIVIRGLSPTRGRPNVAVLQDDIDISSEAVLTAGGSLLINPRLFDVERIEVVRGPHPALYGRSAFAGALHYVTRKPGDEFEGSVVIDGATFGKYDAKLSLAGPVVPGKLLASVNAAAWSFDGFYRNQGTGKRVGGNDGRGIAATAVWNATDSFKATLRGEYTDDSFDPGARASVIATTLLSVPAAARTDVPVAAGGVTNRGFIASPGQLTFPQFTGEVPDAGSLALNLSPNPRTGKDYEGVSREISRVTLRTDTELESVNLVTLFHYGRGDTRQFQDSLGLGSMFGLKAAAEVDFRGETTLHSEEIRLQSNDPASRFRWTIGGMRWEEDARNVNRSVTCYVALPIFGFPFPVTQGNAADNCGRFVAAWGTTVPYSTYPDELWRRETSHLSAYALLDFDLTEALSVTAEIRRTSETERVSGPSQFIRSIDPYGLINGAACTPVAPATTSGCLGENSGPTIREQTDNDYWTPRVGINFRPSEDLLVYASVSEGVKPGGISTVNGGSAVLNRDQFSYAAEEMRVYEAGFKSSFLDKRAVANAAVFYQDYSDKQASIQIVLPNGLTAVRIQNAASASAWGVDLEAGFAVSEHLNLNLGYSWLRAEYGDYTFDATSTATVSRAGMCTPVVNYRLPDGSIQRVVNPTALPAGGAVIASRQCIVDLSGRTLEGAPTHSLQFNANYRRPLGVSDLTWFGEVGVQATSKRFIEDNNLAWLSGYATADLQLGLESPRWSVVGYVTNVLNDDTTKSAFNNLNLPGTNFRLAPAPATLILPPLLQPALADKRQFGLRARYRF
jgi:outer membrane receptor protein involved in Fe transport